MKYRFTLLFLFLKLYIGFYFLFTGSSYGQSDFTSRPEFLKANTHWGYGWNGSINFNTYPPSIWRPYPPFRDHWESFAAVSDTATGELLFYSTGENVRNRDNQIMPNGDNLQGWYTIRAGTCIAPVVGDPDKFYVFNVIGGNALGWRNDAALTYSIIDMKLDNGMGDVISNQKNIVLNDTTILGEGLSLVPGDNCDIWLLCAKYGGSLTFLAYNISNEGINPVPVISHLGTLFGHAIGGQAQFAISPNRKMLSYASRGASECSNVGFIPNGGGVIIAEFDAATGIISNGIKISDSIWTYSSGFSPDNSKLYVTGATIYFGQTLDTGMLLQYDVTNYNASAIISSKFPISKEAGVSGDIRRYLDEVYVSAGEALTVIRKPNLRGLQCDYQLNLPFAFNLDPIPNFYANTLGNDIVYPLPPDTSFYTEDIEVCKKNEGNFLQAPEGFTHYLWSNGDTSSASEILESGLYWVISNNQCGVRIDTFRVDLIDFSIDLGNDTTLCGQKELWLSPTFPEGTDHILWSNGSSDRQLLVSNSGHYWIQIKGRRCTYTDTIHVLLHNLDLGEDRVFCNDHSINEVLHSGFDTGNILWNTGSTEPGIQVSDTGLYWVYVNIPPCELTDSIRISKEFCECSVFYPNAFSPNGDGLNDVFFPVIESDCPVSYYNLNIYNRYGERVFHSVSQDKGWDGRYQGKVADAGVYFFDLKFRGGTKNIEKYYKGDVSLVR